VVVSWKASATGRDGIEVEANVSWTLTLRQGKIVRIVYFSTQQEALEATGRPE
jgi:ketosteroid isomerase-like protein